MRVIQRDPRTPASVDVKAKARAPMTDPTAGVPLPAPRPPSAPKHRLVALGDSLTQGFQSGAVYRTELAFPHLVAKELGPGTEFRFARFEGTGGLPLNIEYVVRRLEQTLGTQFRWWEAPEALLKLRSVMDDIEDYWERGAGALVPPNEPLHHNLGVYGWDLRDVLSRTRGRCERSIGRPRDNLVFQVVESANARTALRVLPGHAVLGGDPGVLDVAEALGRDGGIETLFVTLGSNNALGSVVELNVVWSKDGYDDLDRKRAFTVWDPEHFAAELARVAERVRRVQAEHVIWGTVPHVTIAPIARGVGGKLAPDSRYFPYYTRPWIRDGEFDPDNDHHITAAEARAVDSAIDQYNDAIVETVRSARRSGLDWYVLDIAGVLDRLAQRRYIDSPAARPEWWTPYELPEALQALDPVPNSHFLKTGPAGRIDGGLFSLDGVHPTTVGYGLLAQEFIRVMEGAGVEFRAADGRVRTSPVQLDFKRLLAFDTLLTAPPASFTGDFDVLGWLDQTADVVGLGRVTLPAPA